jgi:hypothetical protein
MRMEFSRSAWLLRPGGVEVALLNSDRLVWRGAVRPLEHGKTFVTYISPLEPAAFHKVFGHETVPGIQWDKIEYQRLPVDLLGAAANRVEISGLHCLDPLKFSPPLPAS